MAYIGQSYIGQVPTVFGAIDKQSLNTPWAPTGQIQTVIDGTTGSFWLMYTVNVASSLLVVLDGVILEAGVDYQLINSGTKIQFIGPVNISHPDGVYPPASSSICFIIYLGKQFFTGVANSGIVGLNAGSNITLTSTVNPNQTLTYTINSSGGQLGTLSDVQVSGLVSGQTLVWNGVNKWINGSGFANGPVDIGTNNFLTKNITVYGTGAMGLSSLDHGQYSVAIGYQALYNNQSTCINNVGVGYQALYSTSNTSSQGNNVAIGYQSLYGITTGANNTAIGKDSGKNITTGSNNVIVGSYTGTGTPINATGEGYIILSDGSGTVRQSIDSTGGAVIYGSLKVNNGIEPRIDLRAHAVGSTSFATWNSILTDFIDVGVAFSGAFTQLNIPIDNSYTTSTIKNGKHITFRFTATGNVTGNVVFITGADGSFRAVGTASPTIPIDIGQTVYIGCVWNSTAKRWDIVAQAQGGA